MNFVWKADHRLKSPEQQAREVHEVSLARHLDDLATVMTLMCFRVESDFWMPFNRKDPTSENYDHDSESDDGRSVGPAQQQNAVPGENPTGAGENWWGPMSSRMSVKGSADVFQSRLPEDYRNARNNPHLAGEMVANVQQCAPRFRYRYAEEWDYCWNLLQRAQAAGPIAPVPPEAPVPVPISVVRPDFQERQMFGNGASQRSRPPINFFIHTEEGSWDSTAESLARFCQGQNNVSYHYTLRDGIVYDVVDTDLYSWSVLNANVFSINLCFAGSSVNQTRQQWLDRYRDDLRIAAYLAVQDARKYNFSTEVIPPPYVGNARPGISDHMYVTRKLGIGTHTDVSGGKGEFPWDVFKADVDWFAGIGDDDMFTEDDRRLLREVRDLMVEPTIESDSPYDTASGTKHSLRNLVKYTDASAHALSVETGAAMGDVDNVKQVKDAADRGVPRAVAAWNKLPASSKALIDSADPR